MIKNYIYKLVLIIIIITSSYKKKNNIKNYLNKKIFKITIKKKDTFKKNYKIFIKNKIKIKEIIKKNKKISKIGKLILINKKIKNFKKKEKKLKIKKKYSFEKNNIKIQQFKKKKEKLNKYLNSKKILKISIYKNNNTKLKAENFYNYLYLENFFIDKRKNVKKNLKKIFKKQTKVFEKKEIIKKIIHHNLNTREISILASIINKESSFNFEKKKISNFFNKKLKKKIKLQSCATVKYALNIKKVYFKHLKIHSPYNTYKIKRIPPNPIGTVEKKTVKYIIKNKKTKKMFFKKKKDKKIHYFCKDFLCHRVVSSVR